MRRLMNNASNKSDCIQLITGETAKELLSDVEEDEDNEEEETDSEQSPGETLEQVTTLRQPRKTMELMGITHVSKPTKKTPCPRLIHSLQVPTPCGGSPRRTRLRRRPRLTWSTTAVTGTTKATATAANTAAAASKGGSSLLAMETAAATATFGTIMVTNRPQQLRDPSPTVVRAYATAEQQLPPPTGSAGVGPSTIHPPNNAPTPGMGRMPLSALPESGTLTMEINRTTVRHGDSEWKQTREQSPPAEGRGDNGDTRELRHSMGSTLSHPGSGAMWCSVKWRTTSTP
ncbi:hypothetical protein SELMODRAFT_419503 [Selaginella moellendorffii]|uniref:Uncharacterized protein n=1 Tax=Selaginella moellendorffii TaxID=88036 RepID=D8S957_SELML|nr:hypothetical protein SELMODRAFT_419503 [Selaginella moellendorffii]